MNNTFKPKLIITDIDGVWTDGGMFYDEFNNEFKKFNTSDSVGVLLCKELKIPIAIMTGEKTNIVKRRSEKLKIKYLFQGAKDKLKLANNLTEEMGIKIKDVAFIGDDINDLNLLRKVGFSSAPRNAPDYIKKEVDYVTSNGGGEGAFREFIEVLIGSELVLSLIEKIIKKSSY